MKQFFWELMLLFNSIIFSLPLHILRKAYAEMLFKMGNGVTICRNIRFYGPRKISIGDNTIINQGAMLDGRNGLKIGSHVDIGEYSSIWTSEHDPNDPMHGCKGGGVIIGDYAWIAPHVIIRPNVNIGRGAVVATGSVVTKDVPEKSIVAGVPAKVIGVRKNDLNYTLKIRRYL